MHREINGMKIIYTINEGKIFISPWDGNDEIRKCVKVYNDCFPDLSFFHLKANIRHKITSLFSASPEKGIILSVQFLKKNTRLEFESRQCWKMNFYPSVVSIQLMLTSLPFEHRYENSANINRIDIFLPHHKAILLLNQKLFKQLQAKEVLNLSEEKKGLSSTTANKFLDHILKELEKPASKSLCTFFEKFIQSITL